MNMKRKRALICFFLLSLLFVSSIAQAQEIVWAPQQRITNIPTRQEKPVVTLDQQDNIHMAWLDNIGMQELQIVYRKFDKYGAPLTNEIQLTSGTMRSRVNELISVDPNGNILLVYSDSTSIIFRKFNNVGQPLTPEIPVVTNSNHPVPAAFAVDRNGNVHIVWSEVSGSPSVSVVYYIKLNNDGEIQIPQTRLNNDAWGSESVIAVDQSGNAHILWSNSINYGVMYTKLDSNGNTLIDDIRLITGVPRAILPKIATDQWGDLYAIWIDGYGPDIFYRVFDNNGVPRMPVVRVSNRPVVGILDWSQGLVVDSQGNAHVLWQGYSSPLYNVQYSKLSNIGNTLIDDTLVSSDEARSFFSARLAVSRENYAYVVYDDFDSYGQPTANVDVFFKRQYPNIALTINGPPCFGSTVLFNLFSYPGHQYFLLTSLGNAPGIPLPPWTLPLNPDPLFWLSLTAGPALGLEGNIGQLDARGHAQVPWRVPNIPEIRGLTLYFAFATSNGGAVTSVSQGLGITLPS